MEDVVKQLGRPRGYVEAPAKPAFFDTSLRLIGGDNPRGEPFLRVLWGWDIRIFRNGNREALAYPGPFLERWILEKWLPSEFFGSKKQWEEHRYFFTAEGDKIDCLGEYPREGRYGMVMPLVAAGIQGTKEGDYIPCSPDVLLFIEAMMPQIRANTPTAYQSAENYAKLQEQMENEESARWEAAEREVEIFGEEVKMRKEHINRNPVFSMPSHLITGAKKSLWTPDGEKPI